MPPHPAGPGTASAELYVSRRRLNEAYCRDLHRLWEAKGPSILNKVAEEMPATLVKCLTMLMPKELKIEASNPAGRLSDEQLAIMIAELQDRIGQRLAGESAKVINAEPRGVWMRKGMRKANPKSSPKALAYARAYNARRNAERKALKAQQASPSLPQDESK